MNYKIYFEGVVPASASVSFLIRDKRFENKDSVSNQKIRDQ